ncbi:thioredoxin family protein [Agromyces italicus]|uniref:thioredoxin family protein n=1 Tax=Agromyces italicus TaxID=279572 RepID=UPI0003B74932|nr:thioredoxin family protein [Agromyces italicus]
MRLRTLTIVPLLLGALAVTGCSTMTTDAPGAGPTASTSESVETTPPAAATPTGEASPEASEPPAPAGAYLDYEDGAIEATAGPKALFFHASWCPKCRALDEELRAEGPPDGLTVFKVDYDSRTDLRQRYEVTLQTTIVFVDDRGDLISSTVLYDDPSIESLRAAMP